MNFGVLHKARELTDWIFGGSDNNEVLVSDGQWDDYLVAKELQNKGTETMACVSFSALNCLEILLKKQTKTEYNFSDRFTAKMSGTTTHGNYLVNVANSLRHDGFIPETAYPYVNGWSEYYKEMPPAKITLGKSIIQRWEVTYEWVALNEEAFKEALKRGPIQITARYIQGPKDEIFNPTGRCNHAMIIYGYEEGKYWKVLDHYDYEGGHLKRYAWDYKFGAAMLYSIKYKKKPMEVKDNYLYQLVEGNGGFALGLDNCLIIDDTSKVLASFIVRNNGDIKDKTVSVKQGDWDSITHKNLKMDII